MEENNENLASEFSWKRHVKKGHCTLQQLLIFLTKKCSLSELLAFWRLIKPNLGNVADPL